MVTDWSFSIFRERGVQPLRYFLLLCGAFHFPRCFLEDPRKRRIPSYPTYIYIYSIERERGERKKKILKWKGNNSVRPPASSSAFDAEQSRKEPFVAGVEGSFFFFASRVSPYNPYLWQPSPSSSFICFFVNSDLSCCRRFFLLLLNFIYGILNFFFHRGQTGFLR